MSFKRSLRLVSFMSLGLLLLSVALAAGQSLHVVCLGDRATAGDGLPRPDRSGWPAQLEARLEGSRVSTFTAPAAAWTGEGRLRGSALEEAVLEAEGDVCLVLLGVQDARQGECRADAVTLEAVAWIRKLREQRPMATIALLLPPASGLTSETRDRLTREVVPALRRAAFETGAVLVDLDLGSSEKAVLTEDGALTDPFAAERIASILHDVLSAPRKDFDVRSRLPGSAEIESFHGYAAFAFEQEGVTCKVVQPKWTAAGQPWIWRARFFGHEPQLDLALLERGWHVAYCDVSNLYGAPAAVARWERFYELLVGAGLSERPVLEGMSRGGLIIYSWARKHPDRVAGLYGDAPVLDIKSWPGGLGRGPGSPADWQRCLAAWELNEDEVAGFEGNPIDGLEPLAKAGLPIIHVAGVADEVVPIDENTDVLEARYRALGGSIEVIRKPGVGHHPHSLEDPAPLVRFARKAIGQWRSPATIPAPSVEFRGQSAGWGGGIWLDQHEKILELAADHSDLRLVFLGDSITQSWTGSANRLSKEGGTRPFDRHFGRWKAASFGISGDRTEHLSWRIDQGAFEAIDPEVIVLMIGVNNIRSAGHDADEVAAGTVQVVDRLRDLEPQATVIILGSFPTGEPGSRERRAVDRLHDLLVARYGEIPAQVRYLDLRSLFLTESGELHPERMARDGIHLAGPGYDAWGTALQPVLAELLDGR